MYKCTLRDGLKFSNGDALTSEDVKFSFDRMLKINDPDGPAVMFPTLDKVRDPGREDGRLPPQHPRRHLPEQDRLRRRLHRRPRAVRRERPAQGRRGGRLRPVQARLVRRRRGRLLRQRELQGHRHGEELRRHAEVLPRRPGRPEEGPARRRRRHRLPRPHRRRHRRHRRRPGGDSGVEVVEGSSAEVQHLVFNMDDPVAGKLGVRKAIAYLIDRDALIKDVYQGTASPAVLDHPGRHRRPQHGLLRHLRRPPVQGQGRRRAAGRRHHRQGQADPLVHPVALRPRHRPGVEGRSPQQLNDSGLFDADVQSVAFDQYEKDIADGKYGVYVKGWVPDYPDADNFTAPFFGKGNVLSNNYSNNAITGTLIPAHRRRERPLRDRRRLQPAPGHRRRGTPRPPGLAGQAVRRRPRQRLRPGVLPRRLHRLPLLGAQQGLTASAPVGHTQRAPLPGRGALCAVSQVLAAARPTARRGAPARSRTRTPRPAPGPAAPASSAHAPHAS